MGKKKYKKGIESLEKQIKLYEEKKRSAKETGNKELESYYKKEINEMEYNIERRKLKLIPKSKRKKNQF